MQTLYLRPNVTLYANVFFLKPCTRSHISFFHPPSTPFQAQRVRLSAFLCVRTSIYVCVHEVGDVMGIREFNHTLTGCVQY